MGNILHDPYLGLGTWTGSDASLAKTVQRKTLEAYTKRVPLEVSMSGGGGAIKKTLRRSPQFDTSYFKICDEEDPGMRYGIWNHQEDLLINILRPVTNNRAERNITFIDFREATDASTVRGSADWCAIPVFPARPKLTNCTLRYCFDFNKHYEATREALSPNDFALKCFRDPLFDMDGKRIDTEEDWQRAMLMMDVQESMHRQVIDGVDNGTTSFAKGLREWMNDFAADHSAELAGNCAWIAPSVVSAEVLCVDVGKKIEARLKALKEMTRDMKVQGTGRTLEVAPEDFVLVLSEKAAECVIKCHVCQTLCGAQIPLSAMTPSALRDWSMIYPQYLTGGRYGQGYIVTPNGIVIDILRSRRVTDAEMFYIYTGNASDPDGGLRLFMNDYTDYLDYLRRDGKQSQGQDEITSIYGGSVMMLQSGDLCGNRYARWNWSLYDKRPYMQTLWTNLNIASCTVDAPVTINLGLTANTGTALNC